MSDKILIQIKSDIENNNVVLFMKGSSQIPQCGFSATVCSILNNLGVEYKDFNVLLDNDLREGIKLYSDWPTIPQLYIKGEFIGGCDIVKEMYASGELVELLKKHELIA
jgi:monothiol glutaredoxin